jgi:hypothetical protein
MGRTLWRALVGVAVGTAALAVPMRSDSYAAGAPPAAATTPAVPSGPAPGPGTPLPAGWELCILQGIGAPGTAANVAALDEWQTAEGGSTANAAAFNPFNTRRMTDASGAALPVSGAPGGFAAFTTWQAGCAATVATLLQPTMAPVVTALQVGTVSPPGIFLAVVDQTPWCAPSSDGVPCYAGDILASELLGALLNGRSKALTSVLTSYASTGADLRAYEKAAYVTVIEQAQLAVKDTALTVARHVVAGAQDRLTSTRDTLRRIALDNYMSGAALQFDQSLSLVTTPDEQDGIAQYLQGVATSVAVGRFDQARTALNGADARLHAAQSDATEATATSNGAAAAESQALAALEADVQGLESSLSCTTATVVPAPAASGPTTPAERAANAPATTSTTRPAGGRNTTTTTTTTTSASTIATPSAAPPPAPQVGAGQMWQGLEACLASPAPPGSVATAAEVAAARSS